MLENTIPIHFSEAPPLQMGEGEKVATCHSGPTSISEDAAPWEPFRTYMENARININVRQVFPTNFVPEAR